MVVVTLVELVEVEDGEVDEVVVVDWPGRDVEVVVVGVVVDGTVVVVLDPPVVVVAAVPVVVGCPWVVVDVDPSVVVV